MLKVSVVVPTFRSGPELDRLVASLDAQTLPASEFEVVFVDDGSPDHTFERLQRVQSTRPNVRLERIENSGWPCRPRNVGTDLARGEFVAYMDHDDWLYPDALRAAHAFAVAHDADVVNGKEARPEDATWAIDTYRADAAQSLGRTDQNPLIPMNPHKLYRRAFLQEHGIRFREGGRVMWEDIFFNLLVQRHARVVSTMASVPYYHWNQTTGSGSKGFLRSSPEFWRWLREVFAATRDDLAGDEHALPREQLLAHQYRSRLIGSFDGRFLSRPPAERDLIYDACRALQADFAPPALDEHLDRSGRLRAHLLRTDQRDLLERLTQHDPGIPGWGETTTVQWVDGRLEVSAHVQWSTADGRRHALVRDDGRILKDLPEEFRAAVPTELREVTDEVLGARAEVGVRSRGSRVTWMAPSGHVVGVADGEAGRVSFDAAVSAVIDPDSVVFGRPLEPGVWDLNVRCTLGGSIQQRNLRGTTTAVAVLFGDEVRLAAADEGVLWMALGADEGRAVRLLQPDAAAVRSERTPDGDRVLIPLPALAVQRPGTAATRVDTAPARPAIAMAVERMRGRDPFQPQDARIEARDGAGVLVVDVPPAQKRIRLRLGDRANGPTWWVLDARGATPSLTPVHRRPGRKLPAPVQRIGRVARRAVRGARRRLRALTGR